MTNYTLSHWGVQTQPTVSTCSSCIEQPTNIQHSACCGNVQRNTRSRGGPCNFLTPFNVESTTSTRSAHIQTHKEYMSICTHLHTYIHTYILSMRECIIKLYYTTHTTTRPFIPQINTHPNRLSTPNISQAPLHCTALTGHLTHTLSHTCTCAERIRHAAIRTRYSSGPVHREGALAVGRGGGGGSAGRG